MTEVSSALKEWALQEMCFQSPCSAEDLSEICTGPMSEVWRWVIRHARRRENVKTIKGNLDLVITKAGDASILGNSTHHSVTVTNSSFFDSERFMLIEERSRLMGDLHTALMKMQRLKGSLDRSKEDLIKLDNQNSEANVKVQIGQHRVSLLNLYAQKTNVLLSKLSRISSRLKEIILKETCSKQELLFSGDQGLITEEDVKLENLISRCSSLFKDILNGNLTSGKSNVKALVLSEMASISPQSLVKSMAKHSSRLGREVSAKFKENPLDDAEDKDEDDNILESVGQEILEFSRRQVASYKALAAVENSVSMLKETLNDLLLMKASNKPNDDLRTAVEMEALRRSLEQLTLLGQNNPFPEDDLALQQNDIDGLCEIISSLILKSSTHSLKEHQMKTLEIMTSNIPSLSEKISSSASSLKDIPSLNFKALNSAPRWKLSSTKVLSDEWMTLTPTCNLTIHRNVSNFPRLPSVACSSRSDTVGKLVNSIWSVSSLKDQVKKEEHHRAEIDTLKKLQDLELTLSTSIKNQSRNLVPAIDECKSRQKKIQVLLKTFKENHQDWKSQPALSVALSDSCDWGQVEGRTLMQTLDLTKAYLNKLQIQS